MEEAAAAVSRARRMYSYTILGAVTFRSGERARATH